MLSVNPAREIRGSFRLPPNPDLLYPALVSALLTRSTVRFPQCTATPAVEQILGVFSPALSCAFEQDTLVCTPLEHAPSSLDLPEGPLFCRDFVVFALLAAGVELRFAYVAAGRVQRWHELARQCRCTLSARESESGTSLQLEAAPDAGAPAEGLSPDSLHAALGVCFGLRRRFETTLDFQPTTVLRSLWEPFGIVLDVRSAAQRPDDRIARRILRMKGKTLSGDSASTFSLSADFAATAPLEAVLELPGDDVLGALLLAAKALIPRGSLVIENLPLDPWAGTALQFLRRMGANPAVQVSGRGCGGECGMVQLQRFSAAGRKLECVPLWQCELQVPALVVIGMFAEGESVIRSIEQLHEDTPDTVAALSGFLESLGCHHGAMPGGIVVRGASQYDGFDVAELLPAHIAGAWSIAALKCMGTSTVNDRHLLARWPGFGAMLESVCEFRT